MRGMGLRLVRTPSPRRPRQLLPRLPFFSAHPTKSTANFIRAINLFHIYVARLGTVLQYALAVIELDGVWATRYTHATGRVFDPTTVLGAPGQWAFILNRDRDVLAGRL
jgi:hypothetical protein